MGVETWVRGHGLGDMDKRTRIGGHRFGDMGGETWIKGHKLGNMGLQTWVDNKGTGTWVKVHVLIKGQGLRSLLDLGDHT